MVVEALRQRSAFAYGMLSGHHMVSAETADPTQRNTLSPKAEGARSLTETVGDAVISVLSCRGPALALGVVRGPFMG